MSSVKSASVSAKPSGRRPTGFVHVQAANRKLRPARRFAAEGGCIGKLSVGSLAIEASDGHILGLVAWVLNLGAVTVTVTSQPELSWRVKSNAWLSDNALSALASSARSTARDEALFVTRFNAAFYTAHHTTRYGEPLLEHWRQASLPTVLSMVPQQLWVNGREYLPSLKNRSPQRTETDVVVEMPAAIR